MTKSWEACREHGRVGAMSRGSVAPNGARWVALIIVGAAAGCSDPEIVAARASLTSRVGPGSEGAQACHLPSSEWISIGDNEHPVQTGSRQSNGASVSISCSVKPDGQGFVVLAVTSVSNQGSLTIRGHFNRTGEQSPISAQFQSATGLGDFSATDCTASYASNKTMMGVAAGRVWATLDCPVLVDNSRTPPSTCAGSAEFKLENCDQ